MKKNLKVDLRELRKQLVDPVSKQLNHYERRARKLAKEFDLRSKEGRTKGRQTVDEFVSHLNDTRGNFEKRVRDLVDAESKRLNKRVNDLFKSLKTMARTEAEGARKKKGAKKTSTKSKKTTKKKSTKKKAAKKKSAARKK